MNLYAISTGSWVEIREARRAPKLVKNSLKVTKVKVKERNPETGRMRTVVKDGGSIDSFIFIGGRVIGYINKYRFYGVTQKFAILGKPILIPKEVHKRLLENLI